MDSQQIKSERIVERYLTGDLLVREARDFETFCQEHPEALDAMPIPLRLKTLLSIKPSDGTETSIFPAIPSDMTRIAAATGLSMLKLEDKKPEADEDEEQAPPVTALGRFGKPLSILLALAVIGAGVLLWQNNTQQKQIKTLSVTAKAQKIQAPGSVQTLRIVPSNTLPNSPQAVVSLNQAQLLDIRLDISGTGYTSFELTVDKADEARVFQIRRIVADTNKELRFALNSSAFGAGEYEIKLEGINYKGRMADAGWVLLDLR